VLVAGFVAETRPVLRTAVDGSAASGHALATRRPAVAATRSAPARVRPHTHAERAIARAVVEPAAACMALANAAFGNQAADATLAQSLDTADGGLARIAGSRHWNAARTFAAVV
jgi:hypothetical protein